MADHVIDAKNRPLGRIATEIAHALQGKDTAKYERNKIGEGRVIVKNVGELKVTGNKFEGKKYYHHTGYMGHLKTATFRQAFEKSPKKVLEHAVLGMLPKNFIRAKRMKRLIIE
jgi:large subunit ribosomal protein L13